MIINRVGGNNPPTRFIIEPFYIVEFAVLFSINKLSNKKTRKEQPLKFKY
ncbi:hypothetical protein GMA11_04625 [Granulicatella sp. zg-ZJ]|nr:hypothetical protein [Granulicatella sp. zg-ZJ]NEW62674.1 hypothetical protein [Granulicatella sp. zg-ZJ]